jgi:DNA polymerase-3 subunit alpha
LESGGIRDLLQRMKPDHFLDIIATNALYRPGPLKGGMVDEYVDVKHGRKQPEYKHPVLEEILAETNGVMVYQEQVMRILNRLGGIPLASAYTCIKAISKKKEAIINSNQEAFIEGSIKAGLTKKEAEDIWSLIIQFAGYGFNKSHSTAYGFIAYQTAFLKAHYPVEFMAALLSGDIPGRNFKKKDSLVEHLEDCRRMEIEVLPPDVNHSYADFAVADGKIIFGLSAVKGCGGAAPDAIVEARDRDGRFTDLFNFCERVDPHSCNRATIETLVKAGAFDSFGAKRSQLLAIIERAIQSGASAAADRRSGQKNLFADFGGEEEAAPVVNLPDMPEVEERERLLMEKEVLGFYLSSHPLAEHEQTFATYCTHSTADIPTLRDGAEVMMGGMISSIKLAHVRKARPGSSATKYANFDLEDLHGTIRSILWPDDFANHGERVEADAIVVVRGRIDRRGGGDEANLICNEIVPLGELANRYTKGIAIRVDEKLHGAKVLPQLKEILRAYPGGCDLNLVLCLENGKRVMLRTDGMKVGVDPQMRTRVDDLLGAGNFKLMTGGNGVG